MRSTALCVAVLVSAAVALHASGAQKRPVNIADLGPQIGEAVLDFRLPDQTGTPRTLKSILGPSGAMLVFFRSADW